MNNNNNNNTESNNSLSPEQLSDIFIAEDNLYYETLRENVNEDDWYVPDSYWEFWHEVPDNYWNE